MAESMPKLDWCATNLAESFKLFKQRAEMYFAIKDIQGEQKVRYILLAVGEEGLKRYNSWTLTDEQKKDPDVIWQHFEQQLEPSDNFRVCRLKLRHYRQKPDESLDDFVNRCKLLALKCEFTDNELKERLI